MMECTHKRVTWDSIDAVGKCLDCGSKFDAFHMALMAKVEQLQAKAEDADRQRSILQINLDAETTGGNVLDRENERLTAKNKRLESRLKSMSVDRDTNEYQIGELHAKIKELEEALDEKETPAAEVYELRKACRIYKELVQEKKAKVAKLVEALRYLSDAGWFDEESTSWGQERDSRINFAASFLPPKERDDG